MLGEITAPGWNFVRVAHGFAGRDRPVAPHLRVIRVRQVHGAEVLVADHATPAIAGDADGLVTATPGVAVAIATADCVPVLLAAPEAGVVGAVHAGWRGTLAGIASRAIGVLADRFGVSPSQIRAALGPSIGGCCYEVERELGERFAREHGSETWAAWREGAPGKGTLDLRAVNRVLLRRAGVADRAIDEVGPCTACGDADLASYRAQGAAAGRQLSWIGLEA